MSMPLRTALTVVAVAASPLVAASTARAAATELATVMNVTALSAGSGWVSYSERRADGNWRLVAFHNGHRSTLNVAPRDRPFDADIGTDAHGAPVITYSRCAHSASAPSGEQPSATFTGLLTQTDNSGCRLRVLHLNSGRESTIRLPGTAGHSDTTPSMDRGNLAFGRTTRGASITRLRYLPKGSSSLRLLPTGHAPQGCRKKFCLGDIQQLDLRQGHVAMVWHIWAPDIGPSAVWEIASASVGTGRHHVWDAQSFSEEDGGAVGSPSLADDGQLWFVDLNASTGPLMSKVGHVAAGQKRLAPTTDRVWQLAIDGETMYSITGPAAREDSERYPANPCSDVAAPCHFVSQPLSDVTPLLAKVG